MKQFFTHLFILSFCLSLQANNIRVSNVILTGKNTSAGLNNGGNHIFVQFDLSWENSWRSAANTAPNNWDAAWVFVKYRVGTGAWNHAFLNNIGHTATGATIAAGLLTPGTTFNATTNPALGVFVYRGTEGTPGNNNFQGMSLRWNYRVNGVDDNAEIQVQVFAIEMVYVPGGAFTVGDGRSTATTSPSLPGYFLTTITANNVFPGEKQSCCGGNGAGNELNKMTGGGSSPPASGYPNGFNAFYAMKYPITQKGYVDFLNTLTRTQQSNRHVGTDVGNYMAAASGQTTPLNRNGVPIIADPVIADPQSTDPRTYACDLNTSSNLPDGVNEENDGLHIACNWLNFTDVMAYLDWSGLRPITTMEFEKL
jgi:formylglycine-generating enzyme required for sulfatase activity